MTPGESSYRARRNSFWRRHGAGHVIGEALPVSEAWERLTPEQRADEEAGALAGAAAWCEDHQPEEAGPVPRLEGDNIVYDRRYRRP